MHDEQTVFVVDDDLSVRQSLSALIRSVRLQSEAFESAEMFLTACDSTRPGCLVLDLRMPDMSGLELQDALVTRDVRLPIIFVSGHGDVAASVRAMKAGAFDFVEKPYNGQEMLDRIHRALQWDLRRRERTARLEETAARFAVLSSRERDVLQLMVAGLPYKDIAAELGIRYKTVQAHRDRIVQKMHVDGLPRLMRLVLEYQHCGICPVFEKLHSWTA